MGCLILSPERSHSKKAEDRREFTTEAQSAQSSESSLIKILYSAESGFNEDRDTKKFAQALAGPPR
jgi:hypothetical protein